MISKYFSSLEGISVFGIIGLIIFFGMFTVLIIWVLKLDKQYSTKMKNLPLETPIENNNNTESKNEIK